MYTVRACRILEDYAVGSVGQSVAIAQRIRQMVIVWYLDTSLDLFPHLNDRFFILHAKQLASNPPCY